MSNDIITRFAPSPTGFLHVGAYRTALFNYLYAKKHEGKVILRIEDTDKERSEQQYTDNIHDSISWLGLSFDETYVQSEMLASHTDALQRLIHSGAAYVSKEEAKEEGQRSEVIRFKNPNETITFTDLIRGEITFDTTDLKDFVIAKSMDEPLYHLAVVVDDAAAGVTHIIRGEEHISNTPRQILIRRALGLPDGTYAHIPLILAPDKTKLSKRKGAKAITEYRDEGYLPEALINFMAFLGWNPGGEKEVYTVDEIIKEFDLSKIQKGGAVFNEEKLRWFNKEHMKKLSVEAQKVAIEEWFKTSDKALELDDTLLNKLHPVIMERIDVWSDIHTMIKEGEFDYLFDAPSPEKNALVWKKEEYPENTKEYLNHIVSSLENVEAGEFTADSVKEAIWPYAEEKGKGNVLWPMRFALTGREKSPDPFTVAGLLGKKETIARLQVASKLFT